MKTLLKKLLCTFTAFALLSVPAVAFAEDEQPSLPISIGNNPHSNFLVSNSELDTSNLYLNGIRYMPPITPEGRIVMSVGDLMAAKGAADVIENYNANAAPQSSVDPSSLLVISRGSAKLTKTALPDLETVARELGTMEFPEELRNDSTQRLGQALTALEQTLSGSSDQIYSDRITSILQLFSASDAPFNENMTDVYLLLYDIRAAIACGTLPSRILTEEATTNLLAIFRDILEKGGFDLDEIEFWESDEAWVAYAAAENRRKVTAGDKIAISDNTGKNVPVKVQGVWAAPVVPEPPSPDEYVYEPPMPPVSHPGVPM